MLSTCSCSLRLSVYCHVFENAVATGRPCVHKSAAGTAGVMVSLNTRRVCDKQIRISSRLLIAVREHPISLDNDTSDVSQFPLAKPEPANRPTIATFCRLQ